MSLKDKIIKVDNRYLTNAFMQVINDHIYILTGNAAHRTISGEYAIKYNNDFYGLLKHEKVLPQYWYATLRVNGYRIPTEVGKLTHLMIPDAKYIDALLSIHNLSKRNLF